MYDDVRAPAEIRAYPVAVHVHRLAPRRFEGPYMTRIASIGIESTVSKAL